MVWDFRDSVGPPQLLLLVVATLPPACDRCLLESLGLVLVASIGLVIGWPLASRGRLVVNLGLVLFVVVVIGLGFVLRDVAKNCGSWLSGSQLSESLPFPSCLLGILSFSVPVPNYGNGFLYFLCPSGAAGMVSCIARSCPELQDFFFVFPVPVPNTGKAFLVFLFPSQNAKSDSRSYLSHNVEKSKKSTIDNLPLSAVLARNISNILTTRLLKFDTEC